MTLVICVFVTSRCHKITHSSNRDTFISGREGRKFRRGRLHLIGELKRPTITPMFYVGFRHPDTLYHVIMNKTVRCSWFLRRYVCQQFILNQKH